MVQSKRARDFTQGPILSQIIKFSIPLIITGILQLLFNTADTIMVGRWGGATPEECETALAAVGSCGSMINLVVILFSNLSLGSGVSVAQDIGAKRYDGVERTVHTSVLLSLITSIFVTILGFVLARPLLTLMGTDPTVLDQAVPYVRAYFCGIPATMLYNYCASIMRSSGETVRPMRYLVMAGVLNVILNAIMVLVFHLGAMGVGIATAISSWASCILILLHMAKADAIYHLNLRKLRIDREKLKIILRIGIPAGLQGLIFSISHVMIQSTVNSFGKAAVAGNAAGANLEGYVYQPIVAVYHATVTFVGQHKGAKKYQRMKKCILYCAACAATVGLVLGWLMFFFGPHMLQFYVPGNDAAIATGMVKMQVCMTTYFLLGLMEVGSGIMRGLGRSTTAMITSLIGSVAFRVVWLLIVFPYFPTLVTLYLSYPIAWVLTSAIHYVLMYFALRKDIRANAKEVTAEEAPA